ncbi:hypothetical protein M121_4143 [Bacteroides fragilis str. 3783N2-1]|nr:hypothetical protein M121_4143 [Bacteroides fragilis str. 3783N2-1]
MLFWKSNCTGAAVVANAVAIMIGVKKLYNKKGGEPLSIAFPEFIL